MAETGVGRIERMGKKIQYSLKHIGNIFYAVVIVINYAYSTLII